MKRAFLFRQVALVTAATAMVAVSYGLVRLAYGLFLPDVSRDLGITTELAGAIGSGTAISYCIAAGAGFLWGGRRAKAVVVASTTAAVLGSVGMAVAPNAAVFAVAAIVGSLAAGLASPALVAIIARSLAAAQAEPAQGMVNAGMGFGTLVAAGLALLLLPDWRAAWVIAAVAALIAGTIVVLGDAGDSPTAEPARSTPGLEWLARHVPPIAAALLMGAASAAVWNFGRSMLTESGVDEVASVATWAALGVGGIVALLTARTMSALRPWRAWMLATVAVAAATTLLAAPTTVIVVTLATGVVFGWGYTAATNALIGWTAALSPRHAASGTAMLFIALVVGQAIGAGGLGAMIARTNYATAFVTAAVVAALAAAVAAWTSVPRDERPSGRNRPSRSSSPFPTTTRNTRAPRSSPSSTTTNKKADGLPPPGVNPFTIS